jgi:hypothetical protein
MHKTDFVSSFERGPIFGALKCNDRFRLAIALFWHNLPKSTLGTIQSCLFRIVWCICTDQRLGVSA